MAITPESLRAEARENETKERDIKAAKERDAIERATLKTMGQARQNIDEMCAHAAPAEMKYEDKPAAQNEGPGVTSFQAQYMYGADTARQEPIHTIDKGRTWQDWPTVSATGCGFAPDVKPDNPKQVGKIRMELVELGLPLALQAIGAVLTFGAAKHSDYGYLAYRIKREDYTGARVRHYGDAALAPQEPLYRRDEESNLPSLWHAAASAMIELEKAMREAYASSPAAYWRTVKMPDKKS